VLFFHNKQVWLLGAKKEKNLSASPLRFEFLHDFQKLIVRLLPIFQAIFQVSQITQRVLFSRGVVHLRPLRGRRVQPVLQQNVKKRKEKMKKVSASSPKARASARARRKERERGRKLEHQNSTAACRFPSSSF
jgi:hypothetical protein